MDQALIPISTIQKFPALVYKILGTGLLTIMEKQIKFVKRKNKLEKTMILKLVQFHILCVTLFLFFLSTYPKLKQRLIAEFMIIILYIVQSDITFGILIWSIQRNFSTNWIAEMIFNFS